MNSIPAIDYGGHAINELVKDEVIQGIFDKRRLIGYPTQYPDLNNLIGGIRLKTLNVLIAGPGTGKTLLALNLLVHLSRTIPVTYFDMENGIEMTVERILRITYGLSKEFFNDPTNIALIEGYVNQLSSITYYDHVDIAKLSVAEKDKPKKKIDVIISIIKERVLDGDKIFLIDPLQAVVDGDSSSEFFEQGKIAQDLKELAQELNIAVILCHHLKKGGRASDYVSSIEDAEAVKYVVPSLESMKGSSKVGDFATDVWGLVRTHADPDAKKRCLTIMKILKQRSGITGDLRLVLDEKTLRFNSYQKSWIEEAFKDTLIPL